MGIAEERKGGEAALKQMLGGQRTLGPVVTPDVRPARSRPLVVEVYDGDPSGARRRVWLGVSREMMPSPSQVANQGGAWSVSERCSM